MALPRPGRVARIPEALPTGRESLPELAEEQAPPLGIPPVVDEAPPALSPTFSRQAEPADDVPWDAPEFAPEAEVEVVEPPAAHQPYVAPAAHPVASVQAQTVPSTSPMGQMTSPAAAGNVNQVLANMGFEGLELGMGFGAFPTVVLKDDVFITSDGDKLGSTFACVIHTSKPKWIVKSSSANDAEFKYTKDKVNDTSGRPLETIFKIWKAQGLLTGDPIWKPYLDVTAQLVDVNKKEMGQVVILQVPETSIERFKGYLTMLAIEGVVPASVITQVYLGQKVTSTKFPFWPWAYKKWALVSQLGL